MMTAAAQRPFLPRPRGWRFAEGGLPAAEEALSSPRLLPYLAGLRCVDENICTAVDHALLELLISVAIEVDPEMQRDACLVRFSDLQTILDQLGPGGRARIIQSLERLSTRWFSLPSLPRRRTRRVLPLPPILPIRLADVTCRVRDQLAQEGFDRLMIATEAAELRGEAAVLDLVRRYEAMLGIAYHEPQVSEFDAEAESSPAATGDLMKDIPGRGRDGRSQEQAGTTVEFAPLSGLAHLGKGLRFSLAPELRSFLDLSRQEKGRFLPFAYLDVRRLAMFRCRYTAALLKRLMADSASWETYHVRRGRRRLALRRPRIGEWNVVLTLDELADAVSYRWTSGSRRAQVARNILGMHDGAVLLGDGARVMADLSRGRMEDLVAAASLTGDAVTFRLSHLPDLRQLRSQPLDPPDDPTELPPESSPELIRLRAWEDRTMRARHRERLIPVDEPAYTVRLSTWRKIADRCGGLTRTEVERIAEAWRLAIDEMLNAGVEHYGDLTGRLADRRYRGERLRETIDREGPDRAAFRFALEERDDPDLLDPVTWAGLRYDGTRSICQQDLKRRGAALIGRPVPEPALRERRTEGLAEFIDRERKILEDRQSSREREGDELLRRKNEARQAARSKYNASRRLERMQARREREERAEELAECYEYDYLNYTLEEDIDMEGDEIREAADEESEEDCN